MSINHALDTLYNKVNLLESMLEDKKNVNNTKKEEDTQEQINIFDLQNKIFHLEKQLILVSKSLKNLENMCIDGYSEFVEQENCISQLPNDSQLHEMIQNVIEDSTTKKDESYDTCKMYDLSYNDFIDLSLYNYVDFSNW